MKTQLVFFKEIEHLPGRIIIEFINSFNTKVDYETKVCFSGLTESKVDDKNSIVTFYAQTVQTDHTPTRWFEFKMQYGNDFSCANIYLKELDENPHMRKQAEKWLIDHYDEGGQYEKADMIDAYLSGFNRGKK